MRAYPLTLALTVPVVVGDEVVILIVIVILTLTLMTDLQSLSRQGVVLVELQLHD